MNKQTNLWKVATIILFILILVLGFIQYNGSRISYQLGDYELRKSTIEDIYNNFASDFVICKFGTNDCLRFIDLNP